MLRVFCLTRSHRRRRIGVQPISSDVAPAATFRNAPTRNDASAYGNSAARLPLLCEARLNDKEPSAQADGVQPISSDVTVQATKIYPQDLNRTSPVRKKGVSRLFHHFLGRSSSPDFARVRLTSTDFTRSYFVFVRARFHPSNLLFL